MIHHTIFGVYELVLQGTPEHEYIISTQTQEKRMTKKMKKVSSGPNVYFIHNKYIERWRIAKYITGKTNFIEFFELRRTTHPSNIMVHIAFQSGST